MLQKQVYYRIFPSEGPIFQNSKIDVANKMIYIRHLQEIGKPDIFTKDKKPKFWTFATDGIFFNTKQEKVYEEVVAGSFVESFLEGRNGVILSFGQIKSGKTFTTSGLLMAEKDFGILPRILKDIFLLRDLEPENIKSVVKISYVEFYNTYAVDLLDDSFKQIKKNKCKNVRKIHISNEFEALKSEGRKEFVEGCRYSSNVASSVATIHFTRRNMELTNPTETRSRLHIIDLAGSESVADKERVCKSNRPLGVANTTKVQLHQFILTLKSDDSERCRLMERANALLYYLDGDLCGESNLRFIGHIKLKRKHLEVSISMLRFGDSFKGLRTRMQPIRFEMNEETLLTSLRKKIDNFEKEAHLNSILMNEDLVTGMNEDRILHLQNVVSDFLADKVKEVTVMNVADTQAVLKNVKQIFADCQDNVKRLTEQNESLLARKLSLASLKQKSKTSLTRSGSSSRGSKRSSKHKPGPQESVSGVKPSKKISDKELKATSTVTDIATSTTATKRKKSAQNKSTASTGKLSMPGKRKVSLSTITRDSRGSVKSVDCFIPIPDHIPDKEEVWKKFIDSSAYRDKIDEYKFNEKSVRASFVKYVDKIKELNLCREALDTNSQQLLTAQIYRKFSKVDQYDDDDDESLVISYAEKECIFRLDQSKETHLKKLEEVLVAQECLKVDLDNRRSIIKRTEEDFETFCKENYDFPTMDMGVVEDELSRYTFEVDIDHPKKVLGDTEEILVVPETSPMAQLVRNLQKIMLREQKRRKKIMFKIKNQWKKYEK